MMIVFYNNKKTKIILDCCIMNYSKINKLNCTILIQKLCDNGRNVFIKTKK
jgi:hypothetical protein